tara:strand:- start:1175 stop:2230 length:1056 start_codon:yes stop_codon:yes gene_type:complete
MDLTFPNNPTTNQTHTFAGKTWRWNGNAWDAIIETSGGGGTGTVRYTIGISAPSNPVSGDKWFNTTVGLELTYIENKWVAVNAAQGDETTWTREDATTETVGGIPAGTTFSLGTDSISVLEQLLYPYQNVSFSTFSDGISSPREVGNTFEEPSSFSWTGSEPLENWTAGSIAILGPGDVGLTSGKSIGDSPVTISHGPYNETTPATKTFTITGAQTQGSNPSRTTNFKFRTKYFVGKTGAGFVGPGLTAQGFDTVLADNRSSPIGLSKTFSAGAGATAYFVYPQNEFSGTENDDPVEPNPFLFDKGLNLPFGSVLGNTFNHVNDFGVTITYRILMSKNSFSGSAELEIRER